jgi:3-dehydroquinate synthetase
MSLVTETPRGGRKATATRTVEWTAEILVGILDSTPGRVPDLFGDLTVSRRRVVAVDTKFHAIHGDRLRALLARYRIEHPDPVIVQGGERSKTRATVEQITAALEAFDVSRFGEPLLLFGGGVLHDVGGFAAAEYRRGITYRMFATTLVCAIDAGFALKVAISDPFKNRTGQYHPAEAMFTDPAWFRTLDHEQILDGTGEIIKWAVVEPSAPLFARFERHGPRAVAEGFSANDPDALAIMRGTIKGMMHELADNPYELVTERRSYIGHGMSMAFEPQVTHGQAVILDILLTLMIATRRGIVPPKLRDRIVTVIRACGLRLWHDVLDTDRIVSALADTMRHRHGKQSIPVPNGKLRTITYMNEITPDEVRQALDDLYATAHAA